MVLVLSGLGRGMSGEENEVSLRVAKAIPSDVGHGRARISGEHGLDLKPGDIVETVSYTHLTLPTNPEV